MAVYEHVLPQVLSMIAALPLPENINIDTDYWRHVCYRMTSAGMQCICGQQVGT